MGKGKHKEKAKAQPNAEEQVQPTQADELAERQSASEHDREWPDAGGWTAGIILEEPRHNMLNTPNITL